MQVLAGFLKRRSSSTKPHDAETLATESLSAYDYDDENDDEIDCTTATNLVKRQPQQRLPQSAEASFSTADCSSQYDDDDDEDEDPDREGSLLVVGVPTSPVKSVRFSLERNQIHPVVGLGKPPPMSPCQNKAVRFGLQRNQYYPPPPPATSTVPLPELWYNAATLDQWQEQALRDAKALFPEATELKSWLGGGCASKPSSSTTNDDDGRPQQQQHKLNNNNTMNITNAIQQTLTACSKSQSDRLRRNFGHRDDLEAAYADHDELVGLEHFVLCPRRGDPRALQRLILAQGQFCVHRNSGNSTERTLAHVSKCLSRPSRLMAQELALAHFRSLTS